ncbi:FHA domain-containing protein [Pyxidicoccus trucidator]|uniref:FHA domain-containing protein n=1 Tax=Pyxidicoccus trucidator TaxID=2709662 RepID=UPI0013DAB3F5|nr:FHA domain-containing protein [Pyxidicoccus trucidator]
MAPPNPKRPPRPPRPPGTQAPKDSDVELPFDDDEVDPLRADDPRPQRVPQYPAGSRRSRRQGGERGSNDKELPPRFDWGHEYSDPGHPPAFLYVERGPGVGQLVPVKQGPLVMGRSSSSDLRLQHPSISRRHAQLIRRADRFFVKDLSSQNGTFLNRTRVTAEAEVMPGDEIAMGNALLRLRGPGGTPALGVPAITATNTLADGGRKQGMRTLAVALTAAALGSAVAALITFVALGLGGDDGPGSVPPPPATRTGPSTPVIDAAGRPGAATASENPAGADTRASEAPGEAPASPNAMEVAPSSPEARLETPTGAGDVARGSPQARAEALAGPSAMDVARGIAGASTPRMAAGGAKNRTGAASPAKAEVPRRNKK